MVVDIFWLVVDYGGELWVVVADGRYDLAGGGWWWMVMDDGGLWWVVVGGGGYVLAGGGWCWIYFGWGLVVVGCGG